MPGGRDLLHELAGFLQSSYAAQQLAPLLVLFAFPAFILLVLRVPWYALVRRSIHLLSSFEFVPLLLLAQMVLEALGVGFLWNWGRTRGGGAGDGEEESRALRSKKRKVKVGSEKAGEEGEELLSEGSGMFIVLPCFFW